MHSVPHGTTLTADFADVDADVSRVGFLQPWGTQTQTIGKATSLSELSSLLCMNKSNLIRFFDIAFIPGNGVYTQMNLPQRKHVSRLGT